MILYNWSFIEILKLIYNRLIGKQECFNLLFSVYQGNKSKYSKKVYTYRKSLEDNPAFHARSKQDKKKKLNKYKFNAILIKPRVSFNWKIATVPCLNFTYPFSIKKFR